MNVCSLFGAAFRSERFDMTLPSSVVVPRNVVRGNDISLGYRTRADYEFGQVRIPRVGRIEDEVPYHRVGIRSPQQAVFRNRVGIGGSFREGRWDDALGIETSIASVTEEGEQTAIDAVRRMNVSL